jgi:hypothetical protein
MYGFLYTRATIYGKIVKPTVLIPGKRGHLGPLGFSKKKKLYFSGWLAGDCAL